VLNVQLLPLVWLARTRLDHHAARPALAREIQQASGGLPVSRVRSMSEVVSESTARSDFDMWLMTVFALSAVVLATVGIYGLMAYAVTQRTRDIDLRLALGAGPRDVRRMIVRQGTTLASIGIAMGVAGSLSVARVLESVLFSVSARDPAIVVGLAVLMASVAWVAVWVPARSAIRISPMGALRDEELERSPLACCRDRWARALCPSTHRKVRGAVA
jgi:putative ABC transport system permease protein